MLARFRPAVKDIGDCLGQRLGGEEVDQKRVWKAPVGLEVARDIGDDRIITGQGPASLRERKLRVHIRPYGAGVDAFVHDVQERLTAAISFRMARAQGMATANGTKPSSRNLEPGWPYYFVALCIIVVALDSYQPIERISTLLRL